MVAAGYRFLYVSDNSLTAKRHRDSLAWIAIALRSFGEAAARPRDNEETGNGILHSHRCCTKNAHKEVQRSSIPYDHLNTDDANRETADPRRRRLRPQHGFTVLSPISGESDRPTTHCAQACGDVHWSQDTEN
eukprot:5590696-Pleurochrysis_carterae.AAC.1